MQLGPNRSYIMLFVFAVMLLMLAVLLSDTGHFLSGEEKPLPPLPNEPTM